ncbi:MAG: PHP domain-containing protein [Elusimicrobium sp.]|jgi:predicted metal-dependent phosphoesterase TrpH|nr:PHP domain-containing protein [Elusimicrobium sp.]
MPFIDLHTHSKYSDGMSKPSEVVIESAKRAVLLYALTDHDTTEGVAEAKERAGKCAVQFLSGVEVSTSEHEHLHFLGFGVDVQNSAFQKFLKDNSEARVIRIKRIIKKLAAAGVDITEEDVFGRVKGIVSRAHVADALKQKGLAQNRQEGFRKFLVKGAPGYEAPIGASACEAVEKIKSAGGKAVIAHPGIVKDIWDFEKWVNCGLDGIEVFYPSHNAETVCGLLDIAARYDLFVTAGSDNHGPGSGRTSKPGMEIPAAHYERLLKIFNL